jgi:hypothetical protein
MVGKTVVGAVVRGLLCVLLMPGVSLAQSAISGVVRDTSGAVLPGVTVEGSSPALIEKTRSAVTDGQGVYRLVDLRPGIYTITFTLPGFSTVRREGLELPDAFTATVNAELRVGALEETITVTGESPLVDTQSVVQRSVLPSTMIDALPSARLVHNLVLLQPGVGGVLLGASQADQRATTIHGSRGTAPVMIDGFSVNFTATGPGSNSSFYLNVALAQEATIQTAAGSPEYQWGAIHSNVIPKEGSNQFSGYLFTTFTNGDMQADNLTDELKAQGITSVSRNDKRYNVVPAAGGPIMRDTLWFYTAFQKAAIDLIRGDMYYNADQFGWRYVADLSRPAPNLVTDEDWSLRLTWQATPRNKFMFYFDQQPHIIHQRNGTSTSPVYAPEATNTYRLWPNAVYTVVWKSPVTSRLFVDVGGGAYTTAIATRASEDPGYANVDPFSIVPAIETTSNLCFRNSGCDGNGGWDARPYNRTYSTRASATYVTGSHSYKVGMQTRYGRVSNNYASNDYTVTLTNWIPVSLTQIVKPQKFDTKFMLFGLFAMDQWTFGRATLNYGVRYDQQIGTVPANNLAAGPYVPARNYPEVKNVPNYKDLSPRLGFSYDLFGDGKTAIKASANRYTTIIGTSLVRANDPLGLSVLNVTRTFTDGNANFIPDCDLANPLAQDNRANGGDLCGQVSDLNFGKANPRNVGYNPDLLTGWHKSPSEWEYSVSLQQEITTGLSANVAWFRRSYANFVRTDNLLVTPADYDSYCVTAPSHPTLPGGGGYQVCDLYDIKPAKFGQVQNQTNAAADYGEDSEVWSGLDATISARFPWGATVSGGLSTGRRHTVTCAVVDTPTNQYCDTKEPFQTQFKFIGNYPLPWYGIEVSGTYLNIPPQFLSATAVFTSAQIAPTLERNLSAGATSRVTVNLIQPNTVFHPQGRQTQVDFKVSKVTNFGRYRLNTGVEFFNLFNGTGIQRFNNRVNATYPRVLEIQYARYAQLSAQLTF